jgi:hypothetical protein
MDFVKIIRSLEEALYEGMSWLIFYPLTLWMVLRHPLKSMAYSDAEQRDKPEQQYLDTLSPPLFLVLSLLLAYGIEWSLNLPEPDMGSAFASFIYGSTQNLMVFHALIFSVHPLLYAAVLLRCMNHKLDRESLRAPFFAQCYLAGATALLISLAGLALQHPAEGTTTLGLALTAVTTIWYIDAQRRWFMRAAEMGALKALAVVGAVFVASGLVMIVPLIVMAAPQIAAAAA